ncbi:hypothetical protein GUJ93_ZPchr0008g12161 [Zizania palustris]|uniref:Uncharacterized protein n=1 Tax=Zizania palustris TaxID=103762 RepID=A0A8J5R628_ZIZPA|nr:hypothetical protein GUJ93_ZPchr0008g12161 [Zizania palustris]
MNDRRNLIQFLSDESSSHDDDEFIFTVAQIMREQYINDHKGKHAGSMIGHQVVDRNREAGHWRLYNDYFSEEPTYGPIYFMRRFRMRRSLFLRIMHVVEAHDDYFVQKRNAAGKLGLSCLQKITAAFRMLAYGVAADVIDDYVRIGESTSIESLKRMVKSICEVFGDEYLRIPNENDIIRLLAAGEERGFPGMLGSIDCMHWRWKNCPTAWQGSHNDINVLQRSPLFAKLAEGQAPKVNYTVNGHNYTMGYYLADGIYPSWATFVKTIQMPQGNKNKYFAKAQEAVRKDIERAFGVLQARFAIVRGPARFWDPYTLGEIMRACVIMHNMIIEDERDDDLDFNFDGVGDPVIVSHEHTPDLDEFIDNYRKIKDKTMHTQLQDDLVEHLWQRHGNQY